MKYIIAAILALLSLPAAAAVTAMLDRDHVTSGETVQLQLQHDGSTGSQPDISPLKRDFDVLGSSSGSSIQIINGHTSSQAQVSIVLAPKRSGKIVIPPLQWDGQQSGALQLTVGGSSQDASTSHVFFKTALDQKRPYLQAAVVLTVKLYADQPLDQASLSLPASDNLLVRQLGKDKQTEESLNGHRYQVIERKYLLFPQRSGKLILDGPVLDAQIADNTGSPFGNDPFFGNFFKSMPGIATRPLHLTANPIQLNVLPRPASAANWLPAQTMTLEENWHPGKIHAGEPLTRHLHISALGLTGEQLPDPATLISVPDDIRRYPDQSSISNTPAGETVQGSRDQDIALIASRPGHYRLPAIRLYWWDTLHNVQRVTSLPERTLDVLSAAVTPAVLPVQKNAAAQYRPAAQNSSVSPALSSSAAAGNNVWRWISLALLLLWLATVAAWWYLRKPVKQDERIKPPQSADAFRAFLRACQANDPHEARRQLLAWAGSAWPASAPVGLNALSRLLDDDELTPLLRQLDRACCMGCSWQGAALAQSLPKPRTPEIRADRQHALPELYC